MTAVSYEMRRVLKITARRPQSTPKDCKTGVRTFVALASRKLIFVATTFASIGYPKTSAHAEITEAGREYLARAQPEKR